MLQIDKSILSLDILEKKFVCNVKKCLGTCCVHGDSGAPLEKKEVALLKKIIPNIRPFMRSEGLEAIEKQGTSIIDCDGDDVTPLVNGNECAYVIFENGIAKCSIEKAYENKVIGFIKPISCHLYPIRITKYSNFEALNYHQWEVCKPAISFGKKNGVPLYVFLKEPLVRKYGAKWYKKLMLAAIELSNQTKNGNG